ncbi:MAG TPA: DUF1521 domain-containing protein [Luteimonas sp.]|nr:DUF1521 domain-containing protein [Luteimonas sp.]
MGDFITGDFAARSQIAVGGCNGRQSPSTQRTADGKVQFENANYRITADDNNQILIHNKNTGENYRIWGDPHVEVDGKHAFDFWGQTTFVLDDGTRLTIATTPWGEGNNGATVASQLTIVDGGGQYVAHIEGIDSNARGDLGFVDVDARAGGDLEVILDEGNVLRENANGSGFVAVGSDGQLRSVDQAFINATDEVKQGGVSMMTRLTSMFADFGGLSSVSINGAMIEVEGDSDAEHISVPVPPLPFGLGADHQLNVTIARV